jgi:exodeoxyribonuclease VII small subunit
MADLSFEQALKRLEEIVEALETDDLDLEKSVQFYEEGVSLFRHCTQQLQRAEKRIDILQTKADGTLAAEPFVLPDETSGTNGESNSAVTSGEA